MLKTIGLWILKLLLKGLGISMGEKEVKRAEEKAATAIAYAETSREAAEVEKEIIQAQIEVEARERARPRDRTDPFGVESWNRGE